MQNISQVQITNFLLSSKTIVFTIEMSYIGVLSNDKTAKDEPQEEYWQFFKEKAKYQLIYSKNNRTQTQSSEHLSALRKKYRNPMLNEQFTTERKQTSINSKSNKNFTCVRQKHESLDNTKAAFKKLFLHFYLTHVGPHQTQIRIQVSDHFGYNSPIQNEKLNLKSTINTLQTENYQRYIFLALYFKNYDIKFRAKK